MRELKTIITKPLQGKLAADTTFALSSQIEMALLLSAQINIAGFRRMEDTRSICLWPSEIAKFFCKDTPESLAQYTDQAFQQAHRVEVTLTIKETDQDSIVYTLKMWASGKQQIPLFSLSFLITNEKKIVNVSHSFAASIKTK